MGMVAHAEINNLSFVYADEDEEALQHISLSIQKGEFITLVGGSGSGKTTLLKHFKKELLPIGKRSGYTYYDGSLLEDVPDLLSAQEIGMVFQNPENQIVMDTVIQELAFSLENIGLPSHIIQKRIAELISFLGFQDLLHQSVHTLSGGQKQLVNLAAVLVMQPKLLLLDEPTAQLDPIAAKEFLGLLKRINEELGITIILSEHRLDEVMPLATRVVCMDNGRIIYDGSPKTVIAKMWEVKNFRPFIPQIPRLFLECNVEDIPFTVREAQMKMNDFSAISYVDKQEKRNEKQEIILNADHISFQYEKNSPLILRDLTVAIEKGKWVALVGKNGTGKSTLLTILAGLQKARRGKVKWNGKVIHKIDSNERFKSIGYVSQHPYYHFTFDTVWEEIYERARELYGEQGKEIAEDMLKKFWLDSLKERHPHDCSGGEQQLLALCTALLSKPSLLLLDEPTKGLDPGKKERLGELFQQLQKEGTTIVMATHDIEFAAKYVNQCMMLFDGKVIMNDVPKEFFSDNFFYTTSINRFIRKQLPYALTWEDVYEACPSDILLS
ncbi:ATP-binding cassette domain-containing protein [Bacillus clarus]|uniref:ATP-binding cassette domain-containing protein n=1 Tax=Bacillus clarus TaxID=2338372 RepID=A0A090YQW4_9BACI|nr:energy-coupling factor ABC transporter ATP-binding protein [Bacillus clarus]KFN01224.1 heme ABC exporter, ATP-binding protein CcmA [Bacillus clarus]RFT63577.1 ATP-binding cassette domain-containing protein [Bacillus clarus]